MYYQTGEEAPATWIYEFVQYEDKTTSPPPTNEERVIALNEGDPFPAVQSAGKDAYYQTLYKTGQQAAESATYELVAYATDERVPQFTEDEMSITLEKGEEFPPAQAGGREAYWREA